MSKKNIGKIYSRKRFLLSPQFDSVQSKNDICKKDKIGINGNIKKLRKKNNQINNNNNNSYINNAAYFLLV